jgi:cytochrome c553
MPPLSRPPATALALALTMVLALALPARADEPEAPPTWKKTCALCHGKLGRPNASLAKKGVHDLSDADLQLRTTDEVIAETIRKGRPGTLMGAYEDRLSAEEIAALVRFIRTLKPVAEEESDEKTE